MRSRSWAIRGVAGLVLLNGLIAVFQPLLERLPERFEIWLTPIAPDYAGRSLTLFVGIGLIYFSVQLFSRKLVAWWLASTGALLIIATHLYTHRPLALLIVPLASLVSLLLSKPYFRSKSETQSIGRGAVIFVASLLFALVYGVAGFSLLKRFDLGFTFGIKTALIYTLRSYLLLGDPALQPHTRHAAWFLDSLGLLGASSLFYGLYSLFRPLSYRLRVVPEDRQRLETYLTQYSLAADDFFKLWPHDKSYFFSAGAGLAYGVRSGVAMVVGDPLGSPEAIRQIVADFKGYCATNGWNLAFIYVTGHFLPVYQSQDFDLLKVGEDAVVNLSSFAEQTATNKHFRNIRNRFAGEGYAVNRALPPHPPALLEAITAVSRDWSNQPDRKEWKFLAGNFNHQYLQLCPLYVARDGEGKVQAFANQIPCYVKGWATIDLMRHRTDAPKGIMDFLLMSLLLDLQAAGYEKFNLGLAPLAGLDGQAAKPEEKVLALIYRSNQKFISLQGLRQFKSKFEPVWEPKYLAYRGGPTRLPRIALALNRIMRAG